MSLNFELLNNDAVCPTRATKASAGFDLYSSRCGEIPPHTRALVETSISMDIPSGFCGLIWPRSGLSVRCGIETGAGVIDADYKGEVKVVLHNFSTETFKYDKHMRIAQILIMPVITPEPTIGKRFTITLDDEKDTRGSGGFGSSGLF